MSKILRLIFLKETFLLLFGLVWLWFSIGLWVDSNYSEKNLEVHYGVISKMDSVITRVKNKPLFKEVEKQLLVVLNSEKKTFTLLSTENFGFITSKVAEGDTVKLFTKPKVWGIFGLKKASEINHLIKSGTIVLNYEDYKKSISGMFYFTLTFSLTLIIVYIVKLRKRLYWGLGG